MAVYGACASAAGPQSRSSTVLATRSSALRGKYVRCGASRGAVTGELLRYLEEVFRTEEQGSEAEELKQVAAVRSLRDKGILKVFGAATSIPKRTYSLEELRLNRVDTTKLLAPKDDTISQFRAQLQACTVISAVALGILLGDVQPVGLLAFVLLTLYGLDVVAYNGGAESLVLDTLARALKPKYRRRVAYHEAGHFLVAYLLGVLPVSYCLSSLDAFLRSRALNVQAGCKFVDPDFQEGLNSGKLSAPCLQRYCCIAMAGLCAEYAAFNRAEGGLADINQLDQLFRACQFSQAKTDGEVRWAVLNTALLLRKHAAVHTQLTDAMDAGRPVPECIALIEYELANQDDI